MNNDIWPFNLTRGASPSPRDGACLLDVVSWIEYGMLGDEPVCVCPVLAAYARYLNDLFDDGTRQELKKLLPGLAGSFDPSSWQDRSDFIVEESLRNYVHCVADLGRTPVQRLVSEVLLHAASYAALADNLSDPVALPMSVADVSAISQSHSSETQALFREAIDTLDKALHRGRVGAIDPQAIQHAQLTFAQAVHA